MKVDPLRDGKWQERVLSQFEKMKTHTTPYEITFDDKTITILPNVFSPKYFTDSLCFAEELTKIVGKNSLLEIGTGTGIIALYSALGGARVVATDINPDAMKNAQVNFDRYKVDVSARLGNLYEPLKEDEKFDFIFWNHPFNNWQTPVTEILLRAGLDYKYEGLSGYIRGARNHLTPNGRLLVGTGNNADIQSIEALAKENSYSLKLLVEEVLPISEEKGSEINSYLIYEFIDLTQKN